MINKTLLHSQNTPVVLIFILYLIFRKRSAEVCIGNIENLNSLIEL